jgi:hypothetical protein
LLVKVEPLIIALPKTTAPPPRPGLLAKSLGALAPRAWLPVSVSRSLLITSWPPVNTMV